MRARRWVVRAAWLGVAWALGCSPDSLETRDEALRAPPNLILIVIDNLRADHLGAYGYARPTSPQIDAVAARGVVFRNAFAPSSWTKPSIGSLFTSRHPSEHGAVSFARQLDEGLPTLAEGLREAGYTTAGVTGNFIHVGPQTKMTRGFDHWRSHVVELAEEDEGEALWTESTPIGRKVKLRAPSAGEINRQVRKLLPGKLDGPLFLYVHYMEPHASYQPPEPFRARFIRDPGFDAGEGFGLTDHIVELAAGRPLASPEEKRRLIDLYDAEIAAADAGVGGLLQWLKKRGILDDAVVAIVSDHGEAFGEHGSWFHGLNLYAEVVTVPFILSDLRASPLLPVGVEERRAVDLLDLPTTLLALAGSEPGAGMRGRDLSSEGGANTRELVGELHPDPRFDARARDRNQRLVLTAWPHKLILDRDGGVQRFDLEIDPGELRDSAGGSTRDLASRAKVLAAELDGELARRQEEPVAPLDAETLEGLRALGYID